MNAKKKIVVLFGGCSPEYPVSLKSAYSVLTHLDPELYEAIPVGITQYGRWLRYDGNIDHILRDCWFSDEGACKEAFLSPDRTVHGLGEITAGDVTYTRVDAVFPVLHGKNGEDGTVQGLAELAGIPLVGCGTLSSALCMDKYRAHLLAEAAGIKTPKAVCLRRGSKDRSLTESELSAATDGLTFPLYVKPLRAGSSFGITRVSEPEQLTAAAELAFAYDSEIIIEENVEGFEVGCAVLGCGELILGRVDEIELNGSIFDYTEKYTQKNARIHMPARIDSETEGRIQAAAISVYRALDCRGFARVDLFLTPEGQILFNEVNTIPGLTALSRYPNMLRGVGIDYGQILQRLIEDAIEAES